MVKRKSSKRKCKKSQVRRSRDGRCLKKRSPAGRRVLAAKKAARSRSRLHKKSYRKSHKKSCRKSYRKSHRKSHKKYQISPKKLAAKIAKKPYCGDNMIRRKRDGRCLKIDSKAGKRSLAAQKGALKRTNPGGIFGINPDNSLLGLIGNVVNNLVYQLLPNN